MATAPSWIIAILLATLFLLSLDGGWLLHRALRGERGDPRASIGAGYIVAASLGLLSLLISFTLLLSLDRFEVRRRLVVAEADAISTVWLRDHLLPEPYRSRLDTLLRDYVKERRGLAAVGTTPAALDASDKRANQMHQRIWRETAQALREPGTLALADPVLQATNTMFDLPADRRAALDAEVPQPLLWTVVLVAAVTAAITGYGLRTSGHRHRVAADSLFIAAALVITLIIELDEPRGGLIRVPQAPIERAADTILAAPAQ